MRRLYHPWWKWECYRAGFYAPSAPDGEQDPRDAYAEFLSDVPAFDRAMRRVAQEWPNSCEQFLTNQRINRLAWLGQSAMCISTGVPARFRGGFARMTAAEQTAANAAATAFLRKWCATRETGGEEPAPLPREVRGTRNRVAAYEKFWTARGYADGIPDEAPAELERLKLVPSWRLLASALLQNDVLLHSAGFPAPVSEWYGVIKRAEIEARELAEEP